MSLHAAAIGGVVAPGYEAVAAELARNLAERGDAGAAFAAYVDGAPVVDVWGGWADRARELPWREDTIAPVYSGTKGLVATCLLLLVERGALDLDAPVCAYWPEFAAAGKDGILVGHVVSHTAGLPGITTPVSAAEATDDVRMARLLAAQPAVAAPGERLIYHALTFGWLCGELVRRVDGRSVGRFLADEVAQPLALDAWIGLPAEHEPRVAVLLPEQGLGALGQGDDADEADPIAWSIWSNPPRFLSDPLPMNTRAWRAAEIPGGNGVAAARALARLYGCLACGGAIDDRWLLPADAIALGAARGSHGVDPYLAKPLAFGVGFELQTERRQYGPPDAAFGHTGAGGSVHGAWPALRTGFSYVTATLRDTGAAADERSAAPLRALHAAVASRG